VLPGAVRVWSTDTGPDLHNVAFRNAEDGSLVLVVTNGAKAAHAVGVEQGQLHFRYTMPPESVATFTWNPDYATETWEQRARRLLEHALHPAGPDAARDGEP
jgi:glucosylceramidase